MADSSTQEGRGTRQWELQWDLSTQLSQFYWKYFAWQRGSVSSQQSAVSSQSPPQSRSYCVAALALLTVELQLTLPGPEANTSSSRKYFSEKYLKDILLENILKCRLKKPSQS